MKQLFLIWGDPRHGKSTLAKSLSESHGFAVCAVDDVYVNFIHTQYPDLDFPKLHQYIAPHYLHIFNVNTNYPGTSDRYTDHIFGRPVIQHWHQHLLDAIRSALKSSDRLAVEGCLLEDCQRDIAGQLRDDGARTISVQVKNRVCYVEGGVPCSIAQLVAMVES